MGPGLELARERAPKLLMRLLQGTGTVPGPPLRLMQGPMRGLKVAPGRKLLLLKLLLLLMRPLLPRLTLLPPPFGPGLKLGEKLPPSPLLGPLLRTPGLLLGLLLPPLKSQSGRPGGRTW